MSDKDICRIRRRLILGTITEYALKGTAACAGIYSTGCFLARLCSLITMNMILPLFWLFFALGICGIRHDHTCSVEAAEMKKECEAN